MHLVEEAFGITVGTFDRFFTTPVHSDCSTHGDGKRNPTTLQPQHRIKLLSYPPPPTPPPNNTDSDSAITAQEQEQPQGVGAHKDSSGWLTFLYQIGNGAENALEVLSKAGDKWLSAPPVPGTFVVNFGNPFEAATEGAVKATVHRVLATKPDCPTRYSIPFFQGLPLDMKVSEIRALVPEEVRWMRRRDDKMDKGEGVSSFLDERWDSLGESQLRKWVRSHPDVARRWYGEDVVGYYSS